MKKGQSILFVCIGIAILALTIFYILREREKDLLEKQENCIKAYEKMSSEALKSNFDNEGMRTVTNYALYSKKQKSCIETLYVSMLSFKDEKSEAVGYYSIKDIYTGENYFLKLFKGDSESKEVKELYDSKLIELKSFGSNKK